MREEGVDEVDGDTTPRRKTKTKKGKKVSRIKTLSSCQWYCSIFNKPLIIITIIKVIII